MGPARTARGWPGVLFLLLTAAGGAALILVTLLRRHLPAYMLVPSAQVPEPVARLGILGFGGLLLVLARGCFRYRRWAWYGGLILGLYMAWRFANGLSRGQVDFYALLLVVSMPPVWFRREWTRR
ncbi:MAG: hypothetical protein ACE5HQ_01260 [Gemmatimonadota bacterium]